MSMTETTSLASKVLPLGALNGEQKWVDTVLELMKAVDEYIRAACP